MQHRYIAFAFQTDPDGEQNGLQKVEKNPEMMERTTHRNRQQYGDYERARGWGR